MLYKNILLMFFIAQICVSDALYSAQPIAVIISNDDCGFFTATKPFQENTDALYTWLFRSLNSPDCPPLIVSKHLIHALAFAKWIFDQMMQNAWDFNTFYNAFQELPYLADQQVAQKHFNNLALFAKIISNHTQKITSKRLDFSLDSFDNILNTSHDENKNSVQFYLCAYVVMSQPLETFDACPSLYIIFKKNKIPKHFDNLPYPKAQQLTTAILLNYSSTSSQDLATLCTTTFAPYLKNTCMVLIGHGSSQTKKKLGCIAGFSHLELQHFIESLITTQTLIIISCHAGGINSSYIPTHTPCNVLVFSGIENTTTGVVNQCVINVADAITNNKAELTISPSTSSCWSLFSQKCAQIHKYTPQAYLQLISAIAPYANEEKLQAYKMYLFKNKLSQKPACPLPCPNMVYISQKLQQRSKHMLFQDNTTPSIIILEPIIIQRPLILLSHSTMPNIIVFNRHFLDTYCVLDAVTAPHLDFKTIINGFLAFKNNFKRIFLLKHLQDKESTKNTVLIVANLETNQKNNLILYHDTLSKRYHLFSWLSQADKHTNILPSDFTHQIAPIQKKAFNNYYRKIMLNTLEHKNILNLQRQSYK